MEDTLSFDTMTYDIIQPLSLCLNKSAPTFPSNHNCNLCQANSWHYGHQIEVRTPGWTWLQPTFGQTTDSMPSLTFASSTLLLYIYIYINPATLSQSDPHIRDNNRKATYDQRVRKVEYECFSPLVFNTLGGMGPRAHVVYKRQAWLIAAKTEKAYSTLQRAIRCKLFSPCSTITCLHGSRHAKSYSLVNQFDSDPSLALVEGWIPFWLSLDIEHRTITLFHTLHICTILPFSLVSL